MILKIKNITSDRPAKRHPIRQIVFCLIAIVTLMSENAPAAATSRSSFSYPPLSETAEVYLITCGAGSDFYTTFGHTAIRICDSAYILYGKPQPIDIVFNYGTFDFNTPHFYYQFAKGRLSYFLSLEQFDDFVEGYRWEGRAVYTQKLEFTQAEKQRLYELLMENWQPKNRYYQYDFFLDNCATRVRDMIEKSLEDRFFYTERDATPLKSYRQLLHPYMERKMEWWKFGIDLVLGMRCDRKITRFDEAFLPFALMRQTDTLRLSGSDKPLAHKAQQILDERPDELADSFPPLWLFSLIALFYLLLTLMEIKQKRSLPVANAADTVLFASVGLLSLPLLFLWFLSDHYSTQWNLNLLWVNPLLLWLAFRVRKAPLWLLRAVFYCSAIGLLCAALQWPQALPVAAVPLIFTLMLRTAIKISRKNTIK